MGGTMAGNDEEAMAFVQNIAGTREEIPRSENRSESGDSVK